jgi:tricarballylate dehydrogenase
MFAVGSTPLFVALFSLMARAAGLPASVAAAEDGAQIAVPERGTRSERGGQSRYTEAYRLIQSETEVNDDFETHIAENGSGWTAATSLDGRARARRDRRADRLSCPG